jgi:hypothetical protein
MLKKTNNAVTISIIASLQRLSCRKGRFEGIKSEVELAAEKVGRDPLSVSAVFEDAINKGLTAEEAEQKEFENVFGIGAKRDAKGRPIEVGKGSRAQQTSQHMAALQKGEGRV